VNFPSWIGYHVFYEGIEKTWRWTAKETELYDHWGMNEPSNKCGDELCVAIKYDIRQNWISLGCNQKLHCIC